MQKIALLLFFLSFFGISSFGQTFTLMSDDMGGQSTKAQEFNGFGCSGDNISPQLMWENPPEGTKSFAVTVYDPDAPTGSGFWHWVVFNIPADINELPSGSGSTKKMLLPKGAIESVTSYGMPGYGGPCPPPGHGFHTYIYTVYALKTDDLGLDANANPAIVGFNLWMNTIEKASIVSYYKREE